MARNTGFRWGSLSFTVWSGTPHSMPQLRFDNAFLRRLPGDPEPGSRIRQVEGAAWSAVAPTPVSAPRLLAWSQDMVGRLGLESERLDASPWLDVLAGNAQLPGMQPYAMNYGGHQFGHWAGQLGDGRAINLGEAIGPDGQRWEIQLKGAGPTPYSRHADGRAVLRSSLREFVCSEAMHHLRIPSTRALALLATGEGVERDLFYDGRPRVEPGAIVCRVAPSFLRFGSFELPSARGDADLLERLVEFTIDLHFPHVGGASATRRAAWFVEVAERTARLMVDWMRVGFVHGVMNTDNFSILGLTLDYGPFGWLEPVDPNWTPNTSDARSRRYRYAHQPGVGYWNLQRLAGALAPCMDQDALHAALRRYAEVHAQAQRAAIAGKLGLVEAGTDDETLFADLMRLLQSAEADYTLFFRALADCGSASHGLDPLLPAFYSAERLQAERAALEAWLLRYRARLARDGRSELDRRRCMDAANPWFVPRNWLLQLAIERAEQGDPGGVHELLDALRTPYAAQPGREHLAALRPEWARERAGCSMLSCSS